MTALKKIALQILAQAEAMEELENQLQGVPDTSKRYSLTHSDTSGMTQDIRTIKTAEVKVMYDLIKEAHQLTRGYEISGFPENVNNRQPTGEHIPLNHSYGVMNSKLLSLWFAEINNNPKKPAA